MVRRMADEAHHAGQWARRYEPHVKPLNDLVDELGAQDKAGHPPYVAPMYHGIHARVLAVLRDPGPKAGGEKGSGFLSVENDDPTAERQLRFMDGAGLDPAEVVPWNAYPWYINSEPNAAQLRAGTEPLRRVIELLPELRVILLLGGTAQQAWRYFAKAQQGLVEDRGIAVIETYHPSLQALQHPDAAVRGAREEHLRQSFRTAGTIVRGGAGGSHDQPSIVRDVIGRPTGYAGGENEKRWKAAVRAAFIDARLAPAARVQLELDFRLGPTQRGSNEPDLDNLIKSTIDALDDVLGPRPGAWKRAQADDVRVDRITASKRPVQADAKPGARIFVAAASGSTDVRMS